MPDRSCHQDVLVHALGKILSEPFQRLVMPLIHKLPKIHQDPKLISVG